LVTAALQGLYRAGGVAPPAQLAARAIKADDADHKLIELIVRARQRVGNPVPLQGLKALEVSLWAVLRALDPYCFLTTDSAYDRKRVDFQDGVGLELEKGVGGPLRIQAVIPGGPAQRAGIRPHDQITHLDGQSLKGKSAFQAEALWRRLTQAGNTHEFQLVLVRRGLKTPRKLTLKPESFKAETVFGAIRNENNTWDYFLDKKDKVAYIRLGALKRGTAVDFQRALEEITRAGARGLLLDLRWCPGGLLDEAVDAASLLVGDRTIATIDYRDGRKQSCSRRKSGTNGSYLDLPLVVLVNGETLGGGELIAAAIQDSKRGAVAGQRTVGKGSVQNSLITEQQATYHPAGNLTVRLSIGVFTRLSGKNLQRFSGSKDKDEWGIRPDSGLRFAISKQLSRRLGELWTLHSLRPGSSDEAMAMDDPANDGQRQFAVKALRNILKKSGK
jgi:C-terminal peptidase prc